MKIVITGANGHIGNNLVKKLLESGFDLRLIVRKIDDSIKDLNVEYVIGSFNDIEILKKSIFKDDIVIHLAGYIDTKNKKNDLTCDKINFEGTKIIADYSSMIGTQKFIYAASSDAIYKKKGYDGPIYEPENLEVDKLEDNYGRSKAKAVNYLRELKNNNKKFNLSIIYPTACFGINDYKNSQVGIVIKDMMKSKISFSIDGHYNFVDINDICNLVLNLVKTDKNGEYIVSGNIVSVRELNEAINLALNRKNRILNLPFFLAYLGIPFVKYLTRQSLSIVKENCDYRSDKAIKELNYKITSFNESIKNVVKWYQENNK